MGVYRSGHARPEGFIQLRRWRRQLVNQLSGRLVRASRRTVLDILWRFTNRHDEIDGCAHPPFGKGGALHPMGPTIGLSII